MKKRPRSDSSTNPPLLSNRLCPGCNSTTDVYGRNASRSDAKSQSCYFKMLREKDTKNHQDTPNKNTQKLRNQIVGKKYITPHAKIYMYTHIHFKDLQTHVKNSFFLFMQSSLTCSSIWRSA
mmetsp:Transcript_28940/g.43657  ORF Transcript_28940/g.43657 Transcript_28940/m.43657 type:complete len:122 (-) Transcript_28940:2417-2782(-)